MQAATKGRGRPDVATLLGLLIATGGIVGGLILEHGDLKDIMAPTALLIVLGGTLGAVLVTNPLDTTVRAFKAMGKVFFEHSVADGEVVRQIVEYAQRARKNGIVSLESDISAIEDRFLRKALTLAVDGTDLQELRKMMELEIDMDEHHTEAEARVFDSAGGYSPTIGIIGAVLGLIQVMKNLADINLVGRGIAVAFVATIYGVGFANVFFLPAGAKIRARAQAHQRSQELMLEGVIGIVEGMNPKLIQSKLDAYSRSEEQPDRPAEEKEQ
jgi:chemotaxis protein MotA